MSDKSRGKIKWFNQTKGFGFIQQTSGDDLFVHINSIEGKPEFIADGQDVEFIVTRGKKGLQADEVVLV